MKSVPEAVVIAVVTISAVIAVRADADVQEFINDREGWENSVGAYDTITFAEVPPNTIVMDQYRDTYGIYFDGFSHTQQSVGYVNDGFGLRSPEGVRLLFDSPKQWIAADYPGVLGFELVSNGRSLYSTVAPTSGTGNFLGVVSSIAFDEVVIFKPEPFSSTTFIDDLHFGPPIPAPGVLGVFALAAVAGCGRRRGGWKSQLP